MLLKYKPSMIFELADIDLPEYRYCEDSDCPTKNAPDVVESAASSDISTASEVSASEAESKPAITQVM
mgnify:CR=1 FL=1